MLLQAVRMNLLITYMILLITYVQGSYHPNKTYSTRFLSPKYGRWPQKTHQHRFREQNCPIPFLSMNLLTVGRNTEDEFFHLLFTKYKEYGADILTLPQQGGY